MTVGPGALAGDYADALRVLWERSDYDRGFISNPFAGDEIAQLGLRRTALLLDRLGRPQDRYPIVHVAGSKGKGSTCAFAASILRAMGKRVGLTTSPHLHSFRERIQIDGESIQPAAFAAGVARSEVACITVERERPELGRITAFELLIAMALDHFATAECEVAVVEVGLGGLLDATNVVTPVVSAISALDYEHTAILGDTLAEIARNKAGIIKPGVPVATARLQPEAEAVVAETAARQGSPWLLAGRDWRRHGSWQAFDLIGPWGSWQGLSSGLLGDHQADNAGLAVAALWLAFGSDLSNERVRDGLRATRWPGRFEIVERAGHTVVLDGAHTPAAAQALLQAIQSEFPDRRATVVLGVLRGKQPAAMAKALAPIADRVVAVMPPGARGLPADELAAAIAGTGLPVSIARSIDAALGEEAGLLVVTGSLTTVAAAREALELAIAEPIEP